MPRTWIRALILLFLLAIGWPIYQYAIQGRRCTEYGYRPHPAVGRYSGHGGDIRVCVKWVDSRR